MILDQTLTDLGDSGTRGANRVRGNFGKFLALVEAGKVPRGSYLVGESLDRISREEVLDVLPAFTHRWRKNKPAPAGIGPGSKSGRRIKPEQRPTSRPMAGLAPDQLATLKRKGWTVSGKWLMPPTTPKPRKPSQPKQSRTRKPEPAHDTKRSPAKPPRSLPQSSVLKADLAQRTEEEWRRSIN